MSIKKKQKTVGTDPLAWGTGGGEDNTDVSDVQQTDSGAHNQTGGALRMQKSPVEDANFLSRYFFW